MGCFLSSPAQDQAPTVPVIVPEPVLPGDSPAPAPTDPVSNVSVLKSGVEPTTTHTVHSGVHIPQNQQVLVGVGLKRQVSITLKAIQSVDEDIQIVKHGIHYLIQNTNAIVDIQTGSIVGELKDEKPIRELTDYVQAMCKKYELDFQK